MITRAPSFVIERSQTLWHVAGGALPPATAVLARTVEGDYRLEVTFGTIARQCRRFGSALVAVEHAERLLARLEGAGYRRQRRDTRDGTSAWQNEVMRFGQ